MARSTPSLEFGWRPDIRRISQGYIFPRASLIISRFSGIKFGRFGTFHQLCRCVILRIVWVNPSWGWASEDVHKLRYEDFDPLYYLNKLSFFGLYFGDPISPSPLLINAVYECPIL